MIVLARLEDPSDAALIAFDDIGVIGAGPESDPSPAGVRQGRAFVGHAGWGAGQLDAG